MRSGVSRCSGIYLSQEHFQTVVLGVRKMTRVYRHMNILENITSYVTLNVVVSVSGA